LFSCGTNKEGDSYLVEWNESDGAVKRTYHGLGKRSVGVVQFDTTKNRFLAAGDEFMIKFWDMDNVNLLTTTDAENGLLASPCIRFNKEGILLAVSTNDNGIKILANTDGIRLLRKVENRSFDPSRVGSGAVVKAPTPGTFSSAASNAPGGSSIIDRAAPIASIVAMSGDNRSLADVKPRIPDESLDKSRIWKLTEIMEPSQCRSLRLPDNLTAMRVSRLMYTNSGLAILALSSNAVHKLWKWQRTDRNLTTKATASVPPQLWQPASGILMTNDISDTNPEDAVPCYALSKNDSYVMSASGGKISLFNMTTFKTMTTFMPPPPAATFLAFHPQDNNIIAIGMDDSSIQIYNVRVDEVKTKLKGHQKRITGLAFSSVLNVLVSSGADSQDDGAQRWRGRRRTASRAVIEPQIELIEPEIELRSEETKTNSEETNSSNQKSTRSGGDDVAEVERREQVAASGWAIDGAMLGLKMRRQRGANGETDQISSPARGATAVARAEEDDEQDNQNEVSVLHSSALNWRLASLPLWSYEKHGLSPLDYKEKAKGQGEWLILL
ncbi:Topless-related protein 4, partial [Sarracenia purpurea var. burkii]